ncbi:MAG TPA: hypothetical protein VGD17_14985 [Chitinophagaceae bacterium]
MGKERSGKFNSPEGKPSGAEKEEGLGLHPTDPEKLDQYLEITEKYITEEDQIAAHVPVRHPNRNREKGYDRFKNQADSQDNRKSVEPAISDEQSKNAWEELPRILTKEQFAELANFKADTCISAYFNTQVDPTAFRYALQEISVMLKNKGQNQASIDKLLEPGYSLLKDDSFWQNMSQGLAVFISDGFFRYLKMPVKTEPDVIIESSFFVTPLIQILTRKEYFYLLVLSKKQIKLFRADAFGIEFINVPGLPEGMQDAQADDKDEETTFRMGGRGGTGGANFHGVGGGNNVDDKAKLAAYFEIADKVIWKEVLSTESAPLMLAGVEYLIPIYKSVTNYNNISDETLTGSHEREDADTLYSQVMEKMSGYFEQRLNKALELYGNQSATTLTSSVVKDVIPATYYSKVSHLFVQKGAHIWGSFDEMKNELKIHTNEKEGGEDLLDNAVVRALLTGAEVFLVDKDKMPADSILAAVMRY